MSETEKPESKITIVTEDGRKVEGDRILKMLKTQDGRLDDKDRLVADIRDGYDSAERAGLDKPAYKEFVKLRRKGVTAQAYIDFVTKVLQFFRVCGANIQLDLFAQPDDTPVVGEPSDAVYAEGAETLPENGEGEDEAPPEPANDAGNPAEEAGEAVEAAAEPETDTFKPIGEAAETVVETVGEMVRQNDLEEEVGTVTELRKKADIEAAQEETFDPEALIAARLEGEVAGKKGKPMQANPYPVADKRYQAWQRGWGPAYTIWQEKNAVEVKPAAENGEGRKKRGAKGSVPAAGAAKNGFRDKTPRLSATAAAKILGGGTTH